MKKVLAVIVSIFWLVVIVGIPVLVLTGNAAQFIPPSIQEQFDQLGGQDFLDRLGLTTDPSADINEPVVLLGTDTPEPAAEATATPAELPTSAPTDPPQPEPTATPLPAPTAEPTPDTPDQVFAAFPVSVKGQAELRTGPNLESDSVGMVDAGATVLIAAQDVSGDWFQLENGNWIASEVLTSKPPVPILLPGQELTPEATPEVQVTEDAATPAAPALPVIVGVNADANLRSGPGGTFDRVGGANFGSEVTVVGKFATDNWYILDDGSWIFGELLDSVPAVPEVNADGTSVDGGSPVVTNPATTVPPTLQATVPVTTTPTSNTLANLRAAPNTSAAIVGSAEPGQALAIVGKNAAGDWLKLEDGSWIFAELVDDAPSDLPTVSEDAATGSPDGANVPLGEEAAVAEPTTEPATSETSTTGEAADIAATGTVSGTTAAETTTASATASTAAVDANLRGGPATTFDLVGSITAGTALTIVGRNETGDWYQLENGAWIFGELVNGAPADLPVVTP